MRRIRTSRLTGFTLVELIVTVSMIAVLMSLLVPAIVQSRAVSRRTACVSNLRQWALAVLMYADVHHGRLPYRGQGIQPTSRMDAMDDWFNAIPPFMESSPYIEFVRAGNRPKSGEASVWVCPDAAGIDQLRMDELETSIADKIDPATFFAYGMNMALSAPVNGRPDHIDRVGELQTMVFMADGLGPWCSVLPSTQPYSPVARHLGKTVNIAFLDGHVESFSGEEVGCRIGDPKRPDIRWFPSNTKWPGPPK